MMTREERVIGISVIIDQPNWTPYERTVLESMREAIASNVEPVWIEHHQHLDNLLATMWLKIYQDAWLAAHIHAVIDMYRMNEQYA